MSNIYLVFHPMEEPSYARKKSSLDVYVPWNTGQKHKRKFINRDGLWLDPKTNIVQHGSLYFWGEYEAGSIARRVSTTMPEAIHNVLIPARGSVPPIPDAQNTDPYVFGKHFKNICCGVPKNPYKPGDVILFGNLQKGNPNEFLLDTVFVVKDTCPVNFSLNTTQYYKASIQPLKNSKKFYYRGDMYLEGAKYYCYVPCLLSEADIYAKRPHNVHPVIDVKSLGFNLPKTTRLRRAKPITFTGQIWEDVLNAVTRQGWHIGIYIDKV